MGFKLHVVTLEDIIIVRTPDFHGIQKFFVLESRGIGGTVKLDIIHLLRQHCQ